MKRAKQIKPRNFVLKHMRNLNLGAGAHKAKSGKFASRARQKQNFLKNQGKDE